MTRATRFGLIALLLVTPARQVWAQPPPPLVWGCDPEGGAPYVEADPSDPSRLVGFEVDIANLVAAHLHRQPRFTFVAFSSINQSLRRGDFEVSFCGLEEITARRTGMTATVPYYQFREVLTVRAADKDRFRSLADLRRPLGGDAGRDTVVRILLKRAETTYGITAVSYEDDVHPYSDLQLGRVDAVVLDNVVARREELRRPDVVAQPAALEVGYYVGILAPSNDALRDQVNGALLAAMKDGRLEAIFRRWSLWNDDQPALYARVLAERQTALPGRSAADDGQPGVAAGGAQLPADAAHGLAGDHRALVLVDGAGRGRRHSRRNRPRLRALAAPRGAAGLRRAHARHAGPAAVVRSLLRAGRP